MLRMELITHALDTATGQHGAVMPMELFKHATGHHGAVLRMEQVTHALASATG